MSHRGIFNKTHLLSHMSTNLSLPPDLRAPTGRPSAFSFLVFLSVSLEVSVTSRHPPRLCRAHRGNFDKTLLPLSSPSASVQPQPQ